jgi:hypothetical protein
MPRSTKIRKFSAVPLAALQVALAGLDRLVAGLLDRGGRQPEATPGVPVAIAVEQRRIGCPGHLDPVEVEPDAVGELGPHRLEAIGLAPVQRPDRDLQNDVAHRNTVQIPFITIETEGGDSPVA